MNGCLVGFLFISCLSIKTLSTKVAHTNKIQYKCKILLNTKKPHSFIAQTSSLNHGSSGIEQHSGVIVSSTTAGMPAKDGSRHSWPPPRPPAHLAGAPPEGEPDFQRESVSVQHQNLTPAQGWSFALPPKPPSCQGCASAGLPLSSPSLILY